MTHLAHTFRALADPTRLAILGLIRHHGPLCVCEVERILRISWSKASRHLRYLRDAGILEDRRDGQVVRYRLGSIYASGAGLGPASAFLYSGPAVNVLAVVLTATVLGAELGVARAVSAVVFAVFLGLLMHLAFRREEGERAGRWLDAPPSDDGGRPPWPWTARSAPPATCSRSTR